MPEKGRESRALELEKTVSEVYAVAEHWGL